jgi:hypothetical protein
MFKEITTPLVNLSKFRVKTPDGDKPIIRVTDIWMGKQGEVAKVALLIQSFKGLSVYTTENEEDIYMIP